MIFLVNNNDTKPEQNIKVVDNLQFMTYRSEPKVVTLLSE